MIGTTLTIIEYMQHSDLPMHMIKHLICNKMDVYKYTEVKFDSDRVSFRLSKLLLLLSLPN